MSAPPQIRGGNGNVRMEALCWVKVSETGRAMHRSPQCLYKWHFKIFHLNSVTLIYWGKKSQPTFPSRQGVARTTECETKGQWEKHTRSEDDTKGSEWNSRSSFSGQPPALMSLPATHTHPRKSALYFYKICKGNVVLFLLLISTLPLHRSEQVQPQSLLYSGSTDHI